MVIPKHIQSLISEGALTSKDWDETFATALASGKDAETLLVEKKFVTEEDIAKARAALFELPFVDLKEREVPGEVVNIIPQAVAENYQLVAFEKAGDLVSIAIVDPSNYRAIEAIDFWAKKEKLKVSFFITTPSSYKNATKNYKVFTTEVSEALGVIEERRSVEKIAKKSEQSKPLIEVVKRAPVAQIVTAIIKEAFDAGASDIHIEPYQDQMRVRFRIDGQLRVTLQLPLNILSSITSRIKILAGLKIDETRIPQDGRIRIEVDEKFLDLRVSTLPVLEYEKVVMRLLPVEVHIPTLNDLGFWYGALEALERIVARPTGVLLISGPTGSGKTTTLHSMLNTLNKEGVNIITLEDPVEYYLPGVNQVQIHHEVGLTFASGLRSVLRQDPNIVMVGEVRDKETAELAIQAALTGHFMLSTIHSKDVLGVLPRLIDMGVEPFLISSALNTIVAQRLVRKICQSCKEAVTISSDLQDDMRNALQELSGTAMLEGIDLTKPLSVFHGRGCDACNDKGYKGRTVMAEVVAMTDAMREIVRVNLSMEALAQEMKRQKMITMKQDGYLKVLRGITSMEEVLLATRE